MLFGREFGRQVLTGSASPVSIRVTSLDHETVDHPVKRYPVIEFLARQLFNSSNVFRCKIGPHFYDHPAILGFQIKRVFKIRSHCSPHRCG